MDPMIAWLIAAPFLAAGFGLVTRWITLGRPVLAAECESREVIAL